MYLELVLGINRLNKSLNLNCLQKVTVIIRIECHNFMLNLVKIASIALEICIGNYSLSKVILKFKKQ